ncbi:Na+/H+ antiporter [uncultured Microbacterium sp.]|uniref:Na+/H+ antiporter n=1 Tax=uncultured Microbacterium sp. TaxID=191216 RepID=UPI0025D94DB6|nr:Na+/H+ antiporter [uncultured Microbacterium sp.]
MEGLEVTVLLGLSVLAGTLLAPRLRLATPLVLLILGLLLGFVPELRRIELPPETVLLLFLPVMLFWESLTTSLRGVRRSLRYIIPMSTLLVVASAFAVAWVATLFGLPWPAAMILGAAVAPPDATAVAALGRLLPQRTFMKLKAESLTNDGTALVLYAIAISVALGDTVTGWSITATVLVSYLGGAIAGIVVAALAYLTLRRMRNALSINVTLLLVPFTAFLLAELVNASGVLAVVFAGLIIAWASPRITTAASRRTATAAWPFGVYLLNGALFVLIGLEVQLVLHEISPSDVWGLVLLTVAAWAALLVVRYVFQLLMAPFSRPRTPALTARSGPGSLNRARIVSTMAGFRGAVSLAIALSVPLTTSSGQPLVGRDAVVFVTAGVIVLSLLVQGPLLPAIVRWAKLPSDDWAADEIELAQRTISGAAIAALDDIAAEHGISDEVRERARQDGYDMLELANARAFARAQAAADADQIAQLEGMVAAPSAPDTGAQTVVDGAGPVVGLNPAAAGVDAATSLTMLAASTGIDLTQRSPLVRFEEMTRLKLALLERKREVLLRLRREGTVDDLLARRLEAHLDAEELRLSGYDDLD